MAEQTGPDVSGVDDGVRHVVAQVHGPDPDAAARGRFRWVGRYWQDPDLSPRAWGEVGTAFRFTTADRADVENLAAQVGGQWVTLFLDVAKTADLGRRCGAA